MTGVQTCALPIYETAMVGVTDDNGEIIEVDINDSDFDFVFDHNKS